jgi:hypothetical protein
MHPVYPGIPQFLIFPSKIHSTSILGTKYLYVTSRPSRRTDSCGFIFVVENNTYSHETM